MSSSSIHASETVASGRGSLSETAFVVCESRARRPEVSLDRFARCWIPPERRKAVTSLWDDFSHAVYPHDDIVVGLRNRFFLEQLERLSARRGDVSVINLAAGLTSYPYLWTSTQARFVEVDLPALGSFKERRRQVLVENGTLFERPVEFVAADLFSDGGRDVVADVVASCATSVCFVLIEGLSYYAPEGAFGALLEVVRRYGPPTTMVAFDYWPTTLSALPVGLRLERFFAERFDHDPLAYTLLDEAMIRAIPAFELLELSSAEKLEACMAGTTLLQGDDILPERYAVLRASPM